ncbi:kinase-like protein, partial [Auricularia subglabra TFB-10046 SS5]
MDPVPSIQIAFSDETGVEVQAPEPASAGAVQFPIRPKRVSSVSTDMIYKGELHELRIWTSRRVGMGGVGVVFEADMISPNGTSQVVTVKTFKSLFTEGNQTLLAREAARWAALEHPRILPLYGMCEFGVQQVGLVSPLISNGNMKNFILKNPEKDRLRLLGQVAEGLKYLHLTAGVVHGDLKCTNILISAAECALLADFGLSTLIERAETPTATNIRIRNTAPFAAPELFSDQAFNEVASDSLVVGTSVARKPRSKTTYSDAFAFGSLIYEAYACEEPWHGDAAFTVIYKVVHKGETPPRVVSSPNPAALPLDDDLWDLCLKCWEKDPSKRPGCVQILQMLESGAFLQGAPLDPDDLVQRLQVNLRR